MRDGGPGALGRRRSADWKSREMTMPGNDKAGGAGSDDLTIRDVRARLVEVPMRFELGPSADVVRVAPRLLVDFTTDGGITGTSSLFGYLRSVGRALAPVPKDAAGKE